MTYRLVRVELVSYPGLSVRPVTLVPGSVFNIKPRIYLPTKRSGIGIEDTFWVDPNGMLVNITADLQVEPEDIDRAMASAATARP